MGDLSYIWVNVESTPTKIYVSENVWVKGQGTPEDFMTPNQFISYFNARQCNEKQASVSFVLKNLALFSIEGCGAMAYHVADVVQTSFLSSFPKPFLSDLSDIPSLPKLKERYQNGDRSAVILFIPDVAAYPISCEARCFLTIDGTTVQLRSFLDGSIVDQKDLGKPFQPVKDYGIRILKTVSFETTLGFVKFKIDDSRFIPRPR